MSEFSNRMERTARKQHKCFACGDPIEAGERYVRWSGVFDGSFFSSAEHETCSRVYSEYDMDGEGVCDGYALEAAIETADWQERPEHKRQEGEAARDYVVRMLGVHRERKAALDAYRAAKKEAKG